MTESEELEELESIEKCKDLKELSKQRKYYKAYHDDLEIDLNEFINLLEEVVSKSNKHLVGKAILKSILIIIIGGCIGWVIGGLVK